MAGNRSWERDVRSAHTWLGACVGGVGTWVIFFLWGPRGAAVLVAWYLIAAVFTYRRAFHNTTRHEARR
jgi:hypothetical protein